MRVAPSVPSARPREILATIGRAYPAICAQRPEKVKIREY